MGEGCFPEAGRTVEEQVVERFFSLFGGVYGDAEVVLELLLADELIEPPGPQRELDSLIVVPRLAGDDPLLSRRSPVSLECLCYCRRLYRQADGRSTLL